MSPEITFRYALGSIADEAATVEAAVAVIMWGLVGVEQRIGRIALPNNVDRMISVIRDVVALRVPDPETQAQVLAWCQQVKTVYGQRSWILHGIWLGPTETADHKRADLKPFRGQTSLESRSPADLMQVADELKALATGTGPFLQTLVDTVPGPWSAGIGVPTH